MCFLDADDELAIDPVPEIRTAGDATAIVFAAEKVQDGRRRGRHVPPYVDSAGRLDRLTAENPFPLSSVLVRRDRIDAPFDERFISREDWLFWFENPRVFERARQRTEVASVIIHAHGRNKSRNYVRAGAFREKVARAVLASPAESLTRKQRNNLLVQAEIGRIQQTRWPAPSAFARFPCSLRLYAKLWVFAVCRGQTRRLDFYGS